MSLLYLVGSVHWDLKGPERLRKFLGFVRPSYICLEASEQSIQRVLSDRELLKVEMKKARDFDLAMKNLYTATGRKATEEPNNDFELRFLSTLGYETWTSHEHVANDNPSAIIVPLHNHETLLKGQGVYREALGSENVNKEGDLTSHFMDDLASITNEAELQTMMDRNYFEADTFYGSNPEVKRLIPPLVERDDEMEPRLREVVNKNLGTTVFVCGNHHFFADYGNNLYERVQDLSPIRIRLPEIDNF